MLGFFQKKILSIGKSNNRGLIIGGSGDLGASVISTFKKK